MTDKYIKALARHERAAQAVKDIGPKIGESLSQCQIESEYHDRLRDCRPFDDVYDGKTNRVKSHLWHAFYFRETSSCGWQSVGLSEDQVLDALSEGSEYECEHCHRAYELIIERKEARQELGRARLAIRALGKQAIKEIGDV